jgi:glucokinase
VRRFAIGVDLGGTNLRVAVVDAGGRLLEKTAHPMRDLGGRDGVIRQICQDARELTAKHTDAGPCAGVGVGIPGILYLESGVLRQSPNLPGWENFAVRDAIASQLNLPVQVDNDANLAALGEKWRGAGRDVASLCLLTLGTGLGGGLILDGKIWHGFLGMAGEVGHIPVVEHGEPCGCGSHGCLETEVSANAIVRKAQTLLAAGSSLALAKEIQGGMPLTAELVASVAATGDRTCRDLFDSFGRYLGLGLAGLVNVLNLPLYVIGGGVAGAWDLFSPAMFRELHARSYVFAEGSTRVVEAQLGADAGLYGSACLALDSAKVHITETT